MILELKGIEFNNRLNRLHLATNQKLRNKDMTEDHLHIVYVMSSVAVSGGVKIIFEHVNRLKKLGARVTIVSHFEKPSWYPLEGSYIQVPFDLELAKGIPNCDVIVATYWDHIQPCIETGIAPVVYFEQGDFHLFDYQSMNNTLKRYIQKQFELPKFIFTVSSSTATYIKEIYNRNANVIHNAIDENIFSEGGKKYNTTRPYLLMVGGESAKFKGLQDIIKAHSILTNNDVDIDLFWITPERPSEQMKDKVTKYFVQPNQTTIAELYRGASIYISGSHYESFSLPPLEAMACGCPVVTTNNQGVLEYAIHEDNALVCNIDDPQDLATKVEELLVNSTRRTRLIKNGLSTAQIFNWEKISEGLLTFYKDVSTFEITTPNQLDEWEITISETSFIDKEDYIKFLKLLEWTTADMIQAPVVYNIDNVVKIARWEVIANRKQSMGSQVEQCYCPVYPANQLSILNKQAYRYFYKREYEEALEEYTLLINQTDDPLKQIVCFRWIILCLYRLQRKHEAKTKLKHWKDEHQNQYISELDFLTIILQEEDNGPSYEKLSLLGDSTSLPEFLFDSKQQAKHFLN